MQNEIKGIVWAVLTTESINKLLKVAGNFMYPKHLCHHLTLKFRTERKDYENIIGKKIVIKVIELAYDNQIQVAVVDLDSTNLPNQNLIPHITISSQLNTPPVYSNKMLAGQHQKQILKEPLLLDAIIEFFPFK